MLKIISESFLNTFVHRTLILFIVAEGLKSDITCNSGVFHFDLKRPNSIE